MRVYLSTFGLRRPVLPERECVFLDAQLTVKEFLYLLEERHGQGVTEEIILDGKLRNGYIILINGRFNESLARLLNDGDEILLAVILAGG